MIGDDELERIWKEGAAVQFAVSMQNLPAGTGPDAT
jgi:hypothetical protein